LQPRNARTAQCPQIHGKNYCGVQVCCFGFNVVDYLWEPAINRFGEADLTLHGYERLGYAGVVQEWLLQPHCVPAGLAENRQPSLPA
jgi:hypothetical protein